MFQTTNQPMFAQKSDYTLWLETIISESLKPQYISVY